MVDNKGECMTENQQQSPVVPLTMPMPANGPIPSQYDLVCPECSERHSSNIADIPVGKLTSKPTFTVFICGGPGKKGCGKIFAARINASVSVKYFTIEEMK